MRLVVIGALVVIACDSKPDKTVLEERFVDELSDRDYHELIKLAGTVSTVVRHGKYDEEPHLSFQLEHNGQIVTVVSKCVVPTNFRKGVTAKVVGRWVRVSAKIRTDLNNEDFGDVPGPEIFLAREVYTVTPNF
jgi:hypothetical protein